MKTKRAVMAAVWILACCGADAAAQGLTPVGSYANVRTSNATGEPHCYGYSIELWTLDGGPSIGLLDRHDGLCGDPPCEVLTDVSLDRKSGVFVFAAFGVRFVGRLTSKTVEGTFGNERLRLQRERDYLTNSPRDRSVDAWCAFWRTVPRCTGVAELCRTLAR